MTEPLKPDERRQAMQPIGGYLYQIWHSLYAWITLQQDQELYLEGAEDFDRISSEIAAATQVKYVSGTLSLGDAEARKAIDNYLALRERNPDRIVHYHYLTTAAARHERGRPFGEETPGIEYWRRCQLTGNGVDVIRDFFLESERISVRTRNFFTESSDKEVLSNLVRTLTWEIEAPQPGGIERRVLQQLIYTGLNPTIHAPPEVSKKVVNRLLRETFEAAAHGPGQVLTKALYLEIFRDETTLRVPRNKVQITSFTPEYPAGSHSTEALVATWARNEPPPSGESYLVRESVISDLSTILHDHGTLLITGTTGMGKTTLAKQLIGRADNLIWIAMSSIPTESRPQFARGLSLFAPSAISPGSMVVLDDLQHDWFQTTLHDILADVFIVLRECNSLLILTCHKTPPRRFARIVGLNPETERSVPPFSREEIQRFGKRIGCTSREARDWSGLIEMNSGGHPQLVHAHLIALREGTWPKGSLEEVLQPPAEVQEERRDVVQMLISTLKDEPVQLLCYLSLVTTGFRRDHAMKIGEQLAGLELPGIALDSLIGPWIEQLHGGYFKVSPLLSRVYKTALSEQRVVESHKVVAEIFSSTVPLSTLEVSTALFHSFLGKNADILARVTIVLLQSWSGKDAPNIASFLSWIVAIHIEGDSLTWCRAETIVLFRMLQFRVASLRAPEYCDRIIERWDIECDSIEEPQVRSANRFFLCWTVLTLPLGRATSLERTLPYLVEKMEMQSLSTENSILSKILVNVDLPSDLKIIRKKYPGCMDFFHVTQCVETTEDLDIVLEFLDSTEEGVRSKVLAAIEDEVLDPMFVNRPWVNEGKKEKPDWQTVMKQLDRTMQLAESWNALVIYREAGFAIATVQSEYLDEFEKAYEMLIMIERKCGRSPELLEKRATVLYLEKRYGEALDFWRELFRIQRPHPLRPRMIHDVDLVLSRRKAAIAASEMGQWSESITLFLDACNWAYVMGDDSYQSALKADAALVAYLNGDGEQTVNLLFEVLTELDALEKTEQDGNVLTTRRLVSYLILWIKEDLHSDLGDEESLDKPWIGFCSNIERVDEIERMSPIAIDIGYVYIVKVEEELLHRSDIFSRISDRLLSSTFDSVRSTIAHLEVRKAFRRCRFELLVEKIARMVNESKNFMNRYLELKYRGVPDSDLRGALVEVVEDDERYRPIDPGIDFLIGALIAIRLRRPADEDSLFRIWREALGRVEVWPELPSMLALAEDSRTWSLSDSIPVLTSREQDHNRRLVAAMAIGTSLNSQVEAQFYAHSLLFSTLSRSLWKEDIAEYLAELFERQWLRLAAAPALLRMPRLSVPGIVAACESSATGLRKAARIILAAQLAVSSRLPIEAVKSLKKIAE